MDSRIPGMDSRIPGLSTTELNLVVEVDVAVVEVVNEAVVGARVGTVLAETEEPWLR